MSMYLLLIVNVDLILNLFEKFLRCVQILIKTNLMNIDTKKLKINNLHRVQLTGNEPLN